MKNSPLIDVSVIAGLLALLVWPILALTHGEETSAPPPADLHIHVAEQERLDAWLTVKASHAPDRLTLRSDGVVLWTMSRADRDELEWQERVELHLDDHVCSIQVEAVWDETVERTVVQLILEPDGLESESAVMWADSVLDNVVEFEWE